MNDILACRCNNCGDVWDLGKLYETMPDYYERSEFVLESKTCLRCNKEYLPYGNVYNMYDFVFEAVRNVKM